MPLCKTEHSPFRLFFIDVSHDHNSVLKPGLFVALPLSSITPKAVLTCLQHMLQLYIKPVNVLSGLNQTHVFTNDDQYQYLKRAKSKVSLTPDAV